MNQKVSWLRVTCLLVTKMMSLLSIIKMLRESLIVCMMPSDYFTCMSKKIIKITLEYGIRIFAAIFQPDHEVKKQYQPAINCFVRLCSHRKSGPYAVLAHWGSNRFRVTIGGLHVPCQLTGQDPLEIIYYLQQNIPVCVYGGPNKLLKM